MKHFALAGLLIGLLSISGCSVSTDSAEPGSESEDDFDQFAGSQGKADTGYVSARAAELEATIEGKVRVRLPGKTAAELQTLADTINANTTDTPDWEIAKHVTDQVKYSRNTLKAQKYDL